MKREEKESLVEFVDGGKRMSIVCYLVYLNTTYCCIHICIYKVYKNITLFVRTSREKVVFIQVRWREKKSVLTISLNKYEYFNMSHLTSVDGSKVKLMVGIRPLLATMQ